MIDTTVKAYATRAAASLAMALAAVLLLVAVDRSDARQSPVAVAARGHATLTGLADAIDGDTLVVGGLRVRLEGIDTPDDTIAAAFATGHTTYPEGYGSSILIGAWNKGAGRFILSTPAVLGNLDAHPAADRLLVNMILYGQNAPGYASARPVAGQKP